MAAVINPENMRRSDTALRWLEVFVVVQAASTGLLFLPGAQSIRMVIRILPYATSLAFLVLFLSRTTRETLPIAGRWIAGSLLLLVVNLLHPDTNIISAVAHIGLQLSIAAPLFWVASVANSVPRMQRLIWLLFLLNALSAVVGVLQTYYPDTFMPPEFNSYVMANNPDYLKQLSYIGENGERIMRPPGLSDMPGGAAVAGMTVGLLGLLLTWQPRQTNWSRLLCISLSSVGFTAVYLCQVRSLLLMGLVGAVAMVAILYQQGQGTRATQLLASAAGICILSFLWAMAIGGTAITERFESLIVEGGPVASYRSNRGLFVEYTLGEGLMEYPLGAGVGRWGTMSMYFSRFDRLPSPLLHAEIQMTGWLYDGGMPMILLYGGGIAVSIFFAWRVAVTTRDPQLGYCAAIVATLLLVTAGQSMAGPSFNGQPGIQFWLLAAGLHGAWVSVRRRAPRPLAHGGPIRLGASRNGTAGLRA